MNGIKYALIFTAGAVLGAVSAVAMVKEKYESLAQIEIETIRRYYKEKMKKEEKVEEPVKEEKVYEDITNNYKGNTVEEKPFIQKGDEIVDPYDIPYIIDSEEFGEEEEYDTMTLTYFEDKVLVDDVDDVIEDKDTVVGLENLKIFEEFPGCTTIYVRNDVWKTDFEIIKDDWNWSDLQETEEKLAEKYKKPHQL